VGSVRFLSAFLFVLCLQVPVRASSQTPSKVEPTGGHQVAESAATTTGNQSKAISLDVEAADKTGAPISDLHAEDFKVLDNGHPQNITSVQAVGFRGPQNGAPVEVILAIDAINMGKEALTEEFDWLHRYLDGKGGQLDLPTSFVFLEDQTIKTQNHPTRDGAALARYLDSNRPGFRALRTSTNGWGEVQREEISLKALDYLAAEAGKRPGRKLLIWISPGWRTGNDPNTRAIGKSEQSLFARIITVWDELRKAQMTLDMIDPTISGGRVFDFNYQPFLKGVSEARNAEYGHLLLPALAAQSGGQVLYGYSDLPSLIDRCVADGSSYYVVTYDIPQASHADEFHAIEIKINRPGVAARTRAGYYAQP
jgi:VWFA-related protein